MAYGLKACSCHPLKAFCHSFHSERMRIYPGKSIQALQNDAIIISWLFSFKIILPTVQLHILLHSFAPVLVHYKTFTRYSIIKVPNQCRTHNFQSQNTQAKTLTWPNRGFPWMNFICLVFPDIVGPSPDFNPCSPEGFPQTYFPKGVCCNPPSGLSILKFI